MGNRRGGLLFGIIFGTLLGILFAPRKGKELRKQLKDEVAKGGLGAETMKKNFKEMGHDMASTAEEVYNTPEVQKQVRKGKKQVDEFMHQAEAGVNRAEQKVKDFGEKYLDLGDEELHKVSEKIQNASKKVQGKIHTMHKKFMGDFGFTKKPLSKSRGVGKRAAKSSRTKKVKIKKHKK